MQFYPGLHQPSDAKHFRRACISIKRLQRRKKPLHCPQVMIDSGAFTELYIHGRYTHSVADHARQLRRLHSGVAAIEIAVAQDYMCEPFILRRTGLTIEQHQRLTIERYDELRSLIHEFPILPVLQGYDPSDYVRHIDLYGDRLVPAARVGVGSVCKRNGSPVDVANVLATIKGVRADLHLHGFGIKLTAIKDGSVRALLDSADSMAWSYSARKQGRNPHDWREAASFTAKVENLAIPSQGWQRMLPF
jgi:hypothetical protein